MHREAVGTTVCSGGVRGKQMALRARGGAAWCVLVGCSVHVSFQLFWTKDQDYYEVLGVSKNCSERLVCFVTSCVSSQTRKEAGVKRWIMLNATMHVHTDRPYRQGTPAGWCNRQFDRS